MIIPFSFWGQEKKGIITDQLINYIDASDNNSYTNGAGTWFDLTSENNNHTLFQNGAGLPNLDSGGGGSVNFLKSRGNYSIVDLAGVNTSTPSILTIEMWVAIENNLPLMPIGFSSYDVFFNSSGLGYNTFNGDIYGITSTEVANQGIFGNFKHMVFVMNQSVSYTNNKIYINGAEMSLSQVQGSENASNRNFGSIGSFSINGFGSFAGDQRVSTLRIYKKQLTGSEVLQNFNAEKSRFGIQ